METDPASTPLVRAEGLSKTYRVYSSPWDRLRELVSRTSHHREFRALSDVGFTLGAGEGLAVVGQNGAGKSTLLKILAGVTLPTSGSVDVRGKVASILELGSGFHPELTGRQNIVLNAAMLGLGDREIRERTPGIIDFSELGDFIDQPVKVYSTGMTMRLGFAIATQVDPDVLIVDEALSVGDGYFQKKCMDRMIRFLDEGGSLLFCSHAMYYVAAFCRRALWLRDGKPESMGPAEAVIREYENFLLAKGRRDTHADGAEGPEPSNAAASSAAKPARLHSVSQGDDGATGPPGYFRHEDPWELFIEWEATSPDLAFHLAVGLDRVDDVQVLVMSTRHDDMEPYTGHTHYRVRLSLPELPFLSGNFHIQVYLLDEAALHVYDQRKLRNELLVEADGYTVGLIEAEHRWSVE